MNKSKKILSCLLTALLLLGAAVGCTKTNGDPDGSLDSNNPSTSGDGTDNVTDPTRPIDDDALNDLINEALKDGPILPEGELTEIWFDEPFRAYYPKQLDDIYPTNVYVYGELDTTQPVMCFCSQELYDVRVLPYENGAVNEDAVLYTVEKFAPMESLVLQIEVGEEPTVAIRFRDADGETHTYTVANTPDSDAIVLDAVD